MDNNNFKLDKKEFDMLYDDNISKKQYDSIIDKIDRRFFYIGTVIVNKTRGPFSMDYGNYNYEDREYGHFDPREYKEEIEFSSGIVPAPYSSQYIPTKWLYTDFEEEFTKNVNDHKLVIQKEKELKKLKYIQNKENKIKFKSIICSKLTSEELKYIKFK